MNPVPYLHLPDPDRLRRSALAAFLARAKLPPGVADDWTALHRWSCEHHAEFWVRFLEWTGIPHDGERAPACIGSDVRTARFFPHVRLNYAECVLRVLDLAGEDATALIGVDETGRRARVSRGELRSATERIGTALRRRGVVAGDRVASIACNTVETIEACLGSAAIGATWSSVAPDLGTDAVVARFGQLHPVLMFAHSIHRHHGMERPVAEHVRAVAARIPSVREIVWLDAAPASAPEGPADESTLDDWLAQPRPPAPFDYPRLSFDHPLFVLFSSGTTGVPKCLVHGAGGTLLEHLKEHLLHCDFGPRERLLFQTGCGWMMWNWMVGAIATGIPIVVYSGSATWPTPTALLEVVRNEGVTVFGTSPAYLQVLRDVGSRTDALGPLPALRAIQSTGSVLSDALFDWVGTAFPGVALESISGGTDIVGCFVMSSPMVPIRRGECACIGLAMDVRIANEDGVAHVGTGDLVCVNPFPSRPVGIWGDEDGRRYLQSYFSEHPGLWTHGDRITITAQGSVRMLGRSDGTLKVHGVRIGPAEITAIVAEFPQVRESMAIEQRWPDEPGGSRIALLVVLADDIVLDRTLVHAIKREVKRKASGSHVPAVVAAVSGLPRTLNGKLSERAARDAANGDPIVNRAALLNPEVTEEIAVHPSLHESH